MTVAPGSLGVFTAALVLFLLAQLTAAPLPLLMSACLTSLAGFATVLATIAHMRARVTAVSVHDRGGAPQAVVAVNAPVRVVVLAAGHASTPVFGPGAHVVDLAGPSHGEFTELLAETATTAPLALFRFTRRRPLALPDPVVFLPRAGTAWPAAQPPVSGPDGALSVRSWESGTDVDGVRPWRDGDSLRHVHWPSTLRTGTRTVRDRPPSVAPVVVVRPDPLAEPAADARRVAAELSGALSMGASAFADNGTSREQVFDRAGAARWAAVNCARPAAIAWAPVADPDPPRWTMAGSAGLCAASVLILRPAVELSWLFTMLCIAAFAAAGALRIRRPAWIESSPAKSVLAAVSLIVFIGAIFRSDLSGGLVGVLRGPLAWVLVMLMVLHAFEAGDRRAVRFELITALVVVGYAMSLRTDSAGTLQMGVFCVGWAWTLLSSRPRTRPSAPPRVVPVRSRRRLARRVVPVVAGVSVVTAVMLSVPQPSGPSQLALPRLSPLSSPVAARGGLAGPDGSPASSLEGSLRAVPGASAGAYTGFAEQLDTSVRGDLPDTVLFRVRATSPDFWRAQTFATFDGRFWKVDDSSGLEVTSDPVYVSGSGLYGYVNVAVPTTELQQTFFVQEPMSNLVLGAHRPSRVSAAGPVWVRPDGALRAAATFGAGSVYTVTSRRPQVTAELLDAQGDVALAVPPGDPIGLDRYLQVPESTSQRTVDLADSLFADTASTYAGIRAAERWLAANVVYDLDAPQPQHGSDAVDDLLFGSRRGFCEQIASALAIMLRTQGVPARVAAGFVPGERQALSGVYEVRASDAHAWVEVWFPDTGWQAFDPTADVPLAGEFDPGTVGSQLLRQLSGWVAAHSTAAIVALAAALAAGVATSVIRFVVRRRRRGFWGRAQDRFVAVVGAGPATTNAAATGLVVDPARRDAAVELAGLLDAASFDPCFDERDPQLRARAGALLAVVAARRRRDPTGTT